MLVLATTVFSPKFSFRGHFEQRNCTLLPFYDRQFLTISSKYSHVLIEQCSAIHRMSIASIQPYNFRSLIIINQSLVFFAFGSMQKFPSLSAFCFQHAFFVHNVSLWLYYANFATGFSWIKGQAPSQLLSSESCYHMLKRLTIYCFDLPASLFTRCYHFLAQLNH